MTQDEMVGWHHRLDGHEFEQALGVGDGQGGLARCGPGEAEQQHTMGGLTSWEALLRASHQRHPCFLDVETGPGGQGCRPSKS